MIKRRAIFALAVFWAGVLAGPAQARGQYPYTLIDPGTFGGPGSSFTGPGIPLTPDGALLGSADTTTPDADFPSSNPFQAPDPYLFNAFASRAGRLQNLGALPGNRSSAVSEVNGNDLGVGGSETSTVDPFTGSYAIHAVTLATARYTTSARCPGAPKASPSPSTTPARWRATR